MHLLRPLTLACLAFASLLSTTALAEDEAKVDRLLRLIPDDVSVTLAIDDLRGHSRDFFASPLSEGLRQLPAVQAWFRSDRMKGLVLAKTQIEHLLGENISKVRDDLLGDATILTFRLPPGARPDEARGLLLSRVRDRALLDRLLRGINAAQSKKGELTRVAERNRGGVLYWVREFPPGGKPNEYYTILEDQTFAWSNSEDLLQGVIDRKAGDLKGLADDPGFRRVRRRLPRRAAASVFVNPRFLSCLLAAAPKPPKPSEERTSAMLGHYVDALDYLGAALEWRDRASKRTIGLVLHTEEALDRDKLPSWFTDWAKRPAVGPDLARIPSSALAVFSVQLDFEAIVPILRGLTAPNERRKLENFLVVLRGVLLGRDPTTEVLPKVGPGVLGYVEALPEDQGLSLIASVDIESGSEVSAALDNGLRTLLGLYALDTQHGYGQLELQSRQVAGAKVISLSPSTPFCYAVERGRLVLGGNPGSVARAVVPDPDRRSAESLWRLQATDFPGLGSFAAIDLTRFRQLATRRRAEFARRISARKGSSIVDAERDLDQALALLGLFQSGFVTSQLTPDARSAHRTLGLITQPGPDAGTP